MASVATDVANAERGGMLRLDKRSAPFVAAVRAYRRDGAVVPSRWYNRTVVMVQPYCRDGATVLSRRCKQFHAVARMDSLEK